MSVPLVRLPKFKTDRLNNTVKLFSSGRNRKVKAQVRNISPFILFLLFPIMKVVKQSYVPIENYLREHKEEKKKKTLTLPKKCSVISFV